MVKRMVRKVGSDGVYWRARQERWRDKEQSSLEVVGDGRGEEVPVLSKSVHPV